MNFPKKVLPYILLFISAFMLWNTWSLEHAPKPKENNIISPNKTDLSYPLISEKDNQNPLNESLPNLPNAVEKSNDNSVMNNSRIHIITDVMNLSIDKETGNIVESSLLNYPKSKNNSDIPLNLFSSDAKYFYQNQSGFLKSSGEKEVVTYHSDKNEYTLDKNQSSLVVKLSSDVNHSGIIFEKTFIFYPNSYVIDQAYSIKNTGSESWKGYYYAQLARANQVPDTEDGSTRYTYFGAATSTPDEHYNKVNFSSMEKQAINLEAVQNGWVAMLQHYFVSALVPNKNQAVNFYSNVDRNHNLYMIGILSPMMSIEPGQSYGSSLQLYSGPAISKNLEAVSPYLKLTIDYGWLWFISIIIFWLMQHIYDIVGNWGWSIVLVTVVIKLVFYQLSAKSYKSMACMKRLQPQIKVLQERLSGDKQQLSKSMMELYRKEKVNPLGGCFPLLIQIPVFIALYWVIVESVQLRQAPFIFWIHDLALKDPFYVLPIIMGLTMFIQQKISPPPPDPMQAKVMMLLPVFFTVFFLQFPAGLVLYWIVNNTLSIAQQWFMMRKYGDKKSSKKSEKNK